MNTEDIDPGQIKTFWRIDLDWFQLSDRSFATLVRGCLCAKCRQLLEAAEGEVQVDELLSAIRNCCSQEPGFITGVLPVMESVFRIFLANGNQPLDLEELTGQLSEWRAEFSYRTSSEVLLQLLNNDRYYGIRQVQI